MRLHLVAARGSSLRWTELHHVRAAGKRCAGPRTSSNSRLRAGVAALDGDEEDPGVDDGALAAAAWSELPISRSRSRTAVAVAVAAALDMGISVVLLHGGKSGASYWRSGIMVARGF